MKLVKKPSFETQVLIGLIGIQIIWSLNYILSKIVVDIFPPLVWACLRSLVTAIFMAALASALRRPHPKFSYDFFLPLTLFAVLGGVLTQVFFLTGLYHSNSINSAIINTLTPLITLLTVIFLGAEKATLPRFIGTAISFAGVLILSRVEDFQMNKEIVHGNILSLLGCICYGIYLALSKDFFLKYDKIWITAWIFMISAVSLPLISYPELVQFHWPKMTLALWGAALYGIFVSTVLGYFMVIWVVAHAPASRVALFEYFQPILCAGLAWVFLHEELTLRAIVGGGLIFLGVIVSMTNKNSIKTKLFKRLTSFSTRSL